MESSILLLTNWASNLSLFFFFTFPLFSLHSGCLLSKTSQRVSHWHLMACSSLKHLLHSPWHLCGKKKARVGNPFYSSGLPPELPAASQTALLVVIATCLPGGFTSCFERLAIFCCLKNSPYLGLFIASPVPTESVNNNNCQTLFWVFLCASSFAWFRVIFTTTFRSSAHFKDEETDAWGFLSLGGAKTWT